MDFIKKHANRISILMAVLTLLSFYIVKRENDYHTHLNRITKKYIHEMEKNHGFVCFSIGGSLSAWVRGISLKFYCFEEKSIEEARVLELACIERLRQMINSNKRIRPYLEEYPFTSERIGIMICFCNKDLTNFPPEESISLVMNCRNNLIYDNAFNDHRPHQTVLRETYSEAYEKADRVSIEQAKRGFK